MARHITKSLINQLAQKYGKKPIEVLEDLVNRKEEEYGIEIDEKERKVLIKSYEANRKKTKKEEKAEPEEQHESLREAIKVENVEHSTQTRESMMNKAADILIEELNEIIEKNGGRTLNDEEIKNIKFAYIHTDGFQHLLNLENVWFMARGTGRVGIFPQAKETEKKQYDKLMSIIENLKKTQNESELMIRESSIIEKEIKKHLKEEKDGITKDITLEEYLLTSSFDKDRSEFFILLKRGEKLGVKISRRENTENPKNQVKE